MYPVNPQAESTLSAALNLPFEDRLAIVEALQQSLLPDDRPPFSDEWREVIRRRAEEMRSGAVVGVEWAEVQRRADEITRG
jgi:putative addiction module component (TIGR02574 family)